MILRAVPGVEKAWFFFDCAEFFHIPYTGYWIAAKVVGGFALRRKAEAEHAPKFTK